MSMFKRPTDDSSSSDDDDVPASSYLEPDDLDNQPQGAELDRTQSLSSGNSVSFIESTGDTNIANVEQHRNMMLASLLEDFYRTRAVDLLNAASPNTHFHRQSPEAQALARTLFTQASQALTSGGVLPTSTVSDETRNSRAQYLIGFNNLGLQSVQPSDQLPGRFQGRISDTTTTQASLALVKASGPPSMSTKIVNPMQGAIQELAARAGQISLAPHPMNDMQLTSQSQRSHYRSSFREVRLLGKGGFGRVYQTFNLFDQKEYAVKKIPLSPALSQNYRERGHEEIASILREVKALAQLDHCNVVRYHATWIEEPASLNAKPFNIPHCPPLDRRRLLADRPASTAETQGQSNSHGIHFDDASHQIRFETDNIQESCAGHSALPLRPSARLVEISSEAGSDVFTDGLARSIQQEQIVDDPFCYVLHVQMSMYPMTLAQYLNPNQPQGIKGGPAGTRRHCYHLIPALQIMLGILSGLQYVHSNGLVHRDIKPGNIFLSCSDYSGPNAVPDGFQNVGSCRHCSHRTSFHVNPRIGDFGLVADLARDGTGARRGSGTSSDKAVGTEYYRPPKDSKTLGKNTSAINEKLDVFALGVVLVELLCQCGTSMERLDMLRGLQKGRLPPFLSSLAFDDHYGQDSANLARDCIHGMINKDHTQRWSCLQVKAQLERILDYQSENS